MKSKINIFIAISAFLAFYACTGNVTKQSEGNKNPVSSNVEKADPVDQKIKQLNDVAKFIAGIQVDSTSGLFPLTLTPEWITYSNESKLAWDKFKKVSERGVIWRNKEMPEAGKPFETLFYPFSGPDYLFANIFFPNARKYVLIGLEDPGTAPQVSSFQQTDLKDIMSLYKIAIEDVIQLSFFRTNDMKIDLKTNAIDGTTPILMLFLARSGKEIVDVKPMELNADGELVTIRNEKVKHTAVSITFRNPGDTILHYVYYLSTNLADPALHQNIPFKKFLDNIDTKSISFVKSATYLMHKSYFSIIRNTVLNKSALILQDDSGIAYKFFDKTKWSISLFGTYEKPINLFKDFYEPDLFEAFKVKSKPLDFRIGYDSKSHLLLAQKIE